MGTGGSWDVYLVKTDFSGNYQWSKTYGGAGVDIGFDIKEFSDGSLLITGQGSFTTGNYVIKTDPTGIVLWSNEYGISTFGHSYSVDITKDGGFVMLGREGGNFYLVKANITGSSGCNSANVTTISSTPPTSSGTGGNSSSGGTAMIAGTLITSPALTDSVYCISGGCTPPVASFAWLDTALTVNFTNTSSAGTYNWDFGDSIFETTANPSHTYAVSGAYYVCLMVTDSCGIDTICDSVTVYFCPLPTAGFISADSGLTVNFTNTSSGGTYNWDFGDSAFDNTADPSHTYAASGAYYVCLMVTDSCGADTICDSVTVYYCPLPTAGFTSADSGLTVNFTNTSSGGTYNWDFGDSTFETAADPSHTYADSGTYYVCLMVTDSCGADTFCNSVTVYYCPLPTAGFTFTDSGLFTNTSSGGTYDWDFGDSNFDTTAAPSHTYAASGTYYVCLMITDSCGADTFCDSLLMIGTGIREQDILKQIIIYPNPASNILYIQLKDLSKQVQINVFDVVGRLILEKEIINEKEISIDLSGFEEGTYLIEFRMGDMRTIRKVIHINSQKD